MNYHFFFFNCANSKIIKILSKITSRSDSGVCLSVLSTNSLLSHFWVIYSTLWMFFASLAILNMPSRCKCTRLGSPSPFRVQVNLETRECRCTQDLQLRAENWFTSTSADVLKTYSNVQSWFISISIQLATHLRLFWCLLSPNWSTIRPAVSLWRPLGIGNSLLLRRKWHKSWVIANLQELAAPLIFDQFWL